MAGMKSRDWDERYAAVDLVWSAGPNRWVEELGSELPPGRALDVAAAPGGRVVVIGHASRNLGEGWGGPQDPAVLYDPEAVVAEVSDQPVDVESAEVRVRPVETDDGTHEALDTVVVLRRR